MSPRSPNSSLIWRKLDSLDVGNMRILFFLAFAASFRYTFVRHGAVVATCGVRETGAILLARSNTTAIGHAVMMRCYLWMHLDARKFDL